MHYKNKLHSSCNNFKEAWNILNGMLGLNFSRKQISLAVDNTYLNFEASVIVGNLSNNNNHLYGDINLNVTCVFRSFEGEKYCRDEIQ